jgi:hypothetical protein
VATPLATAFTPARGTLLFADVPNVSMTVSLHVLVLAIDRLPTKCGPDRMQRVACQDSAGVCGFVSAYGQETARRQSEWPTSSCQLSVRYGIREHRDEHDGVQRPKQGDTLTAHA